MKFFADFHIHSKYSRATSSQMELPVLDKAAKFKGVKVLGTGDFTHPLWFKHLKENLVPAEQGLFKLKNNSVGTRFMLTAEISCIYSKNNRVRKVHILIFSPDFKTAEKINAQLGWIGNLKSDGRPILGLDAKELTKIVLSTNPECLVVPGHCLLPETLIHSKHGLVKINALQKGDCIYSHTGGCRVVLQTFQRNYNGVVYHVQPFYFRLGSKTTPEHPYFAIKTKKYCPTLGCKMVCSLNCNSQKKDRCPHHYFRGYKPSWVMAKDLEVGDALVFPRFNRETKDKLIIDVCDYLEKSNYRIKNDFLLPVLGMKTSPIPRKIFVNKNFCLLMGYYLSEGYTNSRDCVAFSFSQQEKEYMQEVKRLMRDIFNITFCREQRKNNHKGVELIFYSKVLKDFFRRFFYDDKMKQKTALSKSLPNWVVLLPVEKQKEIFRGWWRGDTGYTSSRSLMNQMKIIALRLGVIPSIGLSYSKEDFNQKMHKIGDRIIKSNGAAYHFSNLAFFNESLDLLQDKIFTRFSTKLKRRHGWLDRDFIYIPIKNIKKENYEGKVYNLEVEKDNSYLTEFTAVHNCWTPWFSVFGSKSGFDTLEECFDEMTPYIYAGETGLSADPAMCWQVSNLDKIALISNGDSHSPKNIAREANAFDAELSFLDIANAIKNKNPKQFLYTIEFFPQEGKYHFDGHRLCNVVFSPEQTKAANGICPVCKKPLTVGVLNRVAELADRPAGFKPETGIPFKSLIPLAEIIADCLGVGVVSKQVEEAYKNAIKTFGCELDILLNVSQNQLKEKLLPEIALGIIKAREGKVNVQPGYDGVYGKISVCSAKEREDIKSQKALF